MVLIVESNGDDIYQSEVQSNYLRCRYNYLNLYIAS